MINKYQANISISPVLGGFIVSYPEYGADPDDYPIQVQEVATTLGKAMRIAKKAVEQFSLVKVEASEAAAD